MQVQYVYHCCLCLIFDQKWETFRKTGHIVRNGLHREKSITFGKMGQTPKLVKFGRVDGTVKKVLHLEKWATFRKTGHTVKKNGLHCEKWVALAVKMGHTKKNRSNLENEVKFEEKVLHCQKWVTL